LGEEEVGLRLIEDPVFFAESLLRFHPFPYQAEILRDRSKRLVACLGRQTGKTTTAAVKAIHYAFTNPGTLTLIVSPSLRQSMIMFDRILGLLSSSKLLYRSVVRRTRTEVQLSNGSKIVALPCSENLLRGYTAHLVIVDEAAFLEDEVITSILFPMLAATGGALILLSTPWGKDNYFHRAFTDPGYSVHHVESRRCPLISAEFLEEQRRNLTEEAYRREYEAEFQEAAQSYFTQELIRSCIDPELELWTDLEAVSPPPGEYYAGCDLGKLQDYSVLAVVRRGGGRLRLVFLKEFPLGTPYPSVVGAILRADERFRLRRLLLDESGVGEAVLDEVRGAGVRCAEGASFAGERKAEYLAHLRLRMEKGEFRMPYCRRLCEQMNEQQYEYTKSGRLRFWHPPRSHDDQLWAVALAVYAAKRDSRGVVLRA